MDWCPWLFQPARARVQVLEKELRSTHAELQAALAAKDKALAAAPRTVRAGGRSLQGPARRECAGGL